MKTAKKLLVMASVFMMAFMMGKLGVKAADVYASELTGLPISGALRAQRPVAIMVDNEKIALDHFGITQADVMYELMNSTANGRITRSMYIVKDWASITRFGSIRSVRPTNLMIAPEYNAITVHDGGPFYCNEYYALPFVPHLSAGFARIKNGKPTEFTEYVTTGELQRRIAAAGYSAGYDQFYPGAHFKFGETNLAAAGNAINANVAALPFPHTASTLRYNAATGTYDHYLYGRAHVDAGAGNAVLTFRNAIIQNVPFTPYDANGYMVYNCIGTGNGYYLTGGKAIPITWVKKSIQDITRFYDASGKEIVLNPGKTYITMVPSDTWAQVAIQ